MNESSTQYTTSINLAFSHLKDPIGYGVKHPLINIITMALCGVISGCDNVEAIAMHADARKDFFSLFLDLSSGIPNSDTFHDVLNRINSAEFIQCFNEWIKTIKPSFRTIFYNYFLG